MSRRLLALFVFGLAPTAFGQAVAVTMRLDTNAIPVGQSTMLHIYAQVVPAYRTNADRIFSWYLDIINTNGASATANYAALQRSTSDNDPQTSSSGTSDGANRRGIYDTFLNLPGAGTTNPVELISLPVTGSAPGRTRFRVQHGTEVPAVSEDFIVAPNNGDEPYVGGDYALASVDLTVVSAPTNIAKLLSITHTNLGGGRNKLTLRYEGAPGYDCYVEYRDQLGSLPGWQTFPNGPHNSGVYIDTNNVPTRFYRVRLAPAGGLPTFSVSISRIAPGQLRLSYPVTASHNYSIEYLDQLGSGSWQTLSGGPYNSGAITFSTGLPHRFFRIKASPK